jgi:hypothetical protein
MMQYYIIDIEYYTHRYCPLIVLLAMTRNCSLKVRVHLTFSPEISNCVLKIATARTNETQISQAGLKYKPVLDNLVDKVWENKPKSPSANVFVHTVKYAGEVQI